MNSLLEPLSRNDGGLFNLEPPMIDNLATYHIHKRDPLPVNDALAYQYILAGNGVFVRAETRFFTALLPITACTVRGLPPLRTRFQQLVPCIPACPVA